MKQIKRLLVGGLFTPKGWIIRAAMILLIFAALHLLGWREDTRIISGTSSHQGWPALFAALRGLLYGLTYFAAVMISPILVIAAVLLAAMNRIAAKHSSAPQSDASIIAPRSVT